MAEVSRQHLGRAHKTFVVRRFARERKVTATMEVAVDPLVADELLNTIDRFHRGSEELLRQVPVKTVEQSAGANFESGQHHAGVSRARAPADRLRLEQDHIDTAFGEGSRRAKAGDSGTDHHHIGTLRERRRLQNWDGDGVTPARTLTEAAA